MVRFSRVNAIWKKELVDTLRDRRTMLAMVVVPIVLYPGLMFASLMAVELKFSQLKQETYTIAVANDAVRAWLTRLIDTDAIRRAPPPTGTPAEDIPDVAASRPSTRPAGADSQQDAEDAAKTDVRHRPPPYRVVVVPDVGGAVRDGDAHAGLELFGTLPTGADNGSVLVRMFEKKKDVRSEIAASGIEGILDRAAGVLIRQRLVRMNLTDSFYKPIEIAWENTATEQEINGWLAGMMIPPILIVLTITGTVYPAIDLTAGERERGTLETLMVAPVPPIDLITGKFIVVTLIGLISAMLNIVAFGATMYFGGLGQLLTQDWNLNIPPMALPWVFVALVPLAVMFGAILLAVSSFARSFKEAQNYVMPVMVAAMLPAFIAVIPGTRLEGPVLVMPVANIVVLTRELFMGHFQWDWLAWVTLSTSLYAAAAVAVAAKLFGQEAVLFADSAALKTVFQRRHFKPRLAPTAAQALLLIAIAYPMNFFIQNALAPRGPDDSLNSIFRISAWIVLLFGLIPIFLCKYLRVSVVPALRLGPPRIPAAVAGVLFGLSTWILARWWAEFQNQFIPANPDVQRMIAEQFAGLDTVSPWVAVVLLALIPAVCEEIFFRGFALSGLRGGLKSLAAVAIVAIAFGVFHGLASRLVVTVTLGALFGLLVIRGASIWPAMIAHLLHNGLTLISAETRFGLSKLLRWDAAIESAPPTPWVLAAAAVTFLGVAILAISGRADARTPARS